MNTTDLQPGRELDAEIARALGHTGVRLAPEHPWMCLRDLTPEEVAHYARFGITHPYLGVADYSTSIAAAWGLLEHPALDDPDGFHRHYWTVRQTSLGYEVQVDYWPHDGHRRKVAECRCQTAAEAICRAFLQANAARTLPVPDVAHTQEEPP